VKVVQWLPQVELLLHAKTKTFISHCGAKSLSEAICAKVPILAFPIFAEQMRNAYLVVRHGIGTKMNKFSMTPKYSFDRLIDVLETNQAVYKRNVAKLAEMLQDQPIRGTEQGVFSTERALRKQTFGLHRKVKGVDFTDFTYFCLDIISFGVYVSILIAISIVL
jgi:glucuronosyltransferase